jgi:hypothetical protein
MAGEDDDASEPGGDGTSLIEGEAHPSRALNVAKSPEAAREEGYIRSLDALNRSTLEPLSECHS